MYIKAMAVGSWVSGVPFRLCLRLVLCAHSYSSNNPCPEVFLLFFEVSQFHGAGWEVQSPCSFFFSSFYLFIYFWLHWVSTAVLSLVAVNRGDSSLQCAGCSLQWPLLLQCMGSRVSVVVAHGLSCPMVMWDLPGLGVEPMSPALPGRFLTMDHQGSPRLVLFSLRPINISVSLGCKAFPVFLPLPWLQFWAQYLILCFVPRIDFSLLPFPFLS